MAIDRNLASINHKLLKHSRVLQSTIRDLSARGRTVSVLEIGCGAGVALMELAREFRHDDVHFHAINKTRRPLESREDLRRTAEQIGLAGEELRSLRLPGLTLGDATRTPFEGECFDLIYLSSVLRFVPRKAEFLEEIARLLRPGGVALLRVASKGWSYPYSLVEDGERLTSHPSRWVLKRGSELIPLDLYLQCRSGGTFDFEFINPPSCVIRMRKRGTGRLCLGLRYDPSLSRPMRELRYGDEAVGIAKGGIRSVYEVGRSAYRDLIVSGVLRDLVPPARPPAAGSTNGIPSAPDPETKQHRRLSEWGVGQRVKVKGRKLAQCFRAAKIKMLPYDRSSDTLMGAVERVDDRNRTIHLLGVDVDLNGAESGNGHAPPKLRPGEMVKVVGEFATGRFLAREIRVVPRPAIVVDVIQGRIEAIDAAAGALRVGGVQVETSADTKIDRIDRR